MFIKKSWHFANATGKISALIRLGETSRILFVSRNFFFFISFIFTLFQDSNFSLFEKILKKVFIVSFRIVSKESISFITHKVNIFFTIYEMIR